MFGALLISDDPSWTDVAEKVLAGLGCRVFTARTPDAAPSVIEQAFVCLMAVDAAQPEDRFTALAAYIRRLYPDIAILRPKAQEGKPDQDAFHRTAAPMIGTLKQDGTVTNVSPPLFAQLMEMEARSCILRIFETGSGRGGLLAFQTGRLINARTSGLSGVDAACTILGWEAADVYIQNAEYPGAPRIQKDLQSIIMASAHMKDEGLDRPAARPAPSLIQQLKARLGKEGPGRAVDAVYPDASLAPAVQSAGDLGQLFGYGRFKLGFAEDGTGARIFVPGPSPVMVTLNSQFPRDSLLQHLSRIMDSI